MSRIAKNPIKISKEVDCTFSNGIFSAKGKLGQIQISVNSSFRISINEDEINSHVKMIEREIKYTEKSSRMKELENWINYLNEN